MRRLRHLWVSRWPWFLVPILSLPVSRWLWLSSTQYLILLILTPFIYGGAMVAQLAWRVHRYPAYDPTKHKLRDDPYAEFEDDWLDHWRS